MKNELLQAEAEGEEEVIKKCKETIEEIQEDIKAREIEKV